MTTQQKVKVASYSQLPVRSGRAITVGNDQIALFKVTTGEVYALADKSPHPKGGVLSDGLVSGNYVFCPVYDWKISLVDGQVQAPDHGQVRTFQVEIEQDDVYLRL